MPRIALALLCLAVWSVAPALGIGVETIRKHPEGTDVALVFVHGLAGGPCSSFESLAFARAGEPVYQCRFYEPRPQPPAGQIPLSWFTLFDRDGAASLAGGRTMTDVDLFTVSYMDAARGSMSVADIGERLAGDEELVKILEDYNHVLFVAHSMGGIVLRRALVRLELSPQRALLDRVGGVLLLGSPSEGAPLADHVVEFGCNWVPAFVRQLFGKFCWGSSRRDGSAPAGTRSRICGPSRATTTCSEPFRRTGAAWWRTAGESHYAACAYETVSEFLTVSVVERLYTSTPGCLQLEGINATHTELSKPTDQRDDRHRWLRRQIAEALRAIENHKGQTWNSDNPLNHLVDQIELEHRQGQRSSPRQYLAEELTIRNGSTESVRLLRLKRQDQPYAGATYAALLASIQEANPCLKVKPDRRRRHVELWTEGAVLCPGPKRAFTCDIRFC